MYTKYHTEGLVLKSFNLGEADRAYHIFTRDLGLVYAKAQSVRELKSKLRPNLQELSHGAFSLVRARDVWRVTHADAEAHFFSELSGDSVRMDMVRRVLKLLRRLLPQEEPYAVLYQSVVHGLLFLVRYPLRGAELENFEVLLVLRILNQLGYLGGSGAFGYVLAAPHINDMHVAEVGRVRHRAVYEINRALRSVDL
ncbi:DNA repair protein RecO [Candidatus Wolfebacteria bacterium]|nr:DNA repair protein RecO [Candidatus Wolfebacteria bacterium]